MTDQLFERCKKYLRSTLLSNKGGVPAHEVNKQYRDLVGEGIPYTQFNYRTLEDFLTSMPDVCEICWSGRDLMVMGVADSATQHIEKMVARQQNSKKGGKGGGRSKPGYFPPRFGGGGSGLSANPPRFGGGGSGFSAESSGFRVGASNGSSYKPGSVFSRLGTKPPLPYVEPRGRPAAAPVKKTTKAPTSPHVKIDLKSTSVQVEKACLETVGGKAVYGRRVQEQLQGRPHGMFSTQVEKVYQKKYEESLPKDWLQVMERAGMARVVRESGTSTLVYPVLFGESGQASLNNNNLSTSIMTRISPVPLPTSSEWDITICSVSSTNQVHLWLGEAATKLTELHGAMISQHMYNDRLGSCISSPEMGHMYSALMGEDKVRRVEVLQVNRSNNTCRCRMIDYGKEVIVNWNKLQKLDKTFYETPAQAIKAILAGVHHQEGGDQVKFVEKYLEGRRLVAVVVDTETEDEHTPSLVLFDTSQEEDIMVSDEIIKHMNNGSSFIQPRPYTSSSLTTPRLPGVGEYYDLVVSHVVSPSLFYVQSHSTLPGYTALHSQMTRYYESNISNMAINNLTPGSLYAVMHSNSWHRAVLVNVLSFSLYCMRLIDTGRMVIVVREKTKPLMEQFKQLPTQAIRARLASVKPRIEEDGWDEAAVEWFKHVALNRSLVGQVEGKVGEELVFTMYDTSVEDVDVVINNEILSIGLAVKK